MSFTGFSEEDLHRIKYEESGTKTGHYVSNVNARKIDKLGVKNKKPFHQYKSPTLQNQNSDEMIDNIDFEKCKLSLKSPKSPPVEDMINNNKDIETTKKASVEMVESETPVPDTNEVNDKADMAVGNPFEIDFSEAHRKNSLATPDVVKCLDNYTENELVDQKIKLEELQLKQRLMEEQNKKKKEMLAKALADRTKQTAEEVQKLEKIKKELQVLDGQFSLDVGVLRKKIDLACLSYSEAEKHYLRIERDFLRAKIILQKEKEKKELLTEHLCALITHNETRKAKKLETLMLELASDKTSVINAATPTEDKPIVIDGVDERTGKMVEITPES